MTEILIVRHGYTDGNLKKIFQGQTDTELLPEGREQARLTAEYLKDERIDAVYSSDLKRAMKTAEYIVKGRGLDVIPDVRLREINGGEWQMKRFTDLPQLYPAEFALWQADLDNAACPGGESVARHKARVFEAFTDIARRCDGKRVVTVTHGFSIRVFESAVSGASVSLSKAAPNASVSRVVYDGGKFYFKSFGESDHLSGLVTSLKGLI